MFFIANNVGKIEVTVFCDGMLISHPVYIDYYDSTSRKEKEMLMIMLYKRISFIRSYFIMDHLANVCIIAGNFVFIYKFILFIRFIIHLLS